MTYWELVSMRTCLWIILDLEIVFNTGENMHKAYLDIESICSPKTGTGGEDEDTWQELKNASPERVDGISYFQ